MMDKIVVEATKREVTGKKVKVLRREGILPAVLYGYGIDSIPVALNHRAAGRILSQAETSSLIFVNVDGTEYPTLVREKQWDYIRRSLIHVDFQVVSMTEKIASMVRIDLTGEATAVKDYGGILLTDLTEVEVEALPSDLPESIQIDLGTLTDIGDSIHVRDLVIGADVTILSDPDAMIATVMAPAAEIAAETDVLLEGEEGTEPEVIGTDEEEEE